MITRDAHAKLNVFLRVLGRREPDAREELGPGDEPRADDEPPARDDLAACQAGAAQAAVLGLEPDDLALDHRDVARGERLGLLGRRRRGGVAQEGDVVGQLAEQLRDVQRHRARGEHGERLVAHLPAVAVRAVQDVARPPLAQPGDVGQLVAQTGGDQ